MTVSSKSAEHALLYKGFRLDDRGDRYFIFHEGDRKTSVFTFISHGSKHDLDDFLVGKMSKQMQLTKREFLTFVSCQIDRAGYLRLLRERKPNL